MLEAAECPPTVGSEPARIRAVKAGRFLNVDPEDALNATCEKFIARFRCVGEGCAARGDSYLLLSSSSSFRLPEAFFSAMICLLVFGVRVSEP